ncbi:gluconate 2-dehydrogenase subunit 3 family protein [Mucilaginibacter achroorhodeus]|uniref:Gluconate 2-dehydrogenase subunit 3 family protein n=1 Tax=Mucilaginibacter achroorhodeus TaxID=2599294 RepID=A0A563U1Z5_9SPHI|nr:MULTISPECIES: gluconate 2-dehydrogenase subunit 3 family protein [Mucilaginibacter]QXV64100.1 gluconate 2-dehydrogenase subunit 3 family protein [Mucilaginibacter sp. 21P]TWR25550.1 gluconate 2-dehydrogenase subunit 3 family protein [Mucilaginibacter achroorhodeus]
MNRRAAIRNMALILGGAIVLPSCLHDDKGKAIVELERLKIDAEQEKLVNSLTQTILPKTDTPGAAELGINLFVFKMMDDCASKEQQADFITGLKTFADEAKNQMNKAFADGTDQERTAFVQSVEKQSTDKNFKDDGKLMAFYQMVKGQTIFGYTTSKFFMTKQVVYELVPGRYNAMYPASKATA